MQSYAGNPELYVSVWLYFPSDWSSTGTDNWYALIDTFIGQQTATPVAYKPYSAIYIHQQSPGIVSIDTDIRDDVGSGQYIVPLASNPNFMLPRGRWFNVQYYIYCDVSNGAVKIWVDGIKVCDRTGVKTKNANDNAFQTTIAKIYGSLAGVFPYSVWVDDLDIYGTP